MHPDSVRDDAYFNTPTVYATLIYTDIYLLQEPSDSRHYRDMDM